MTLMTLIALDDEMSKRIFGKIAHRGHCNSSVQGNKINNCLNLTKITFKGSEDVDAPIATVQITPRIEATGPGHKIGMKRFAGPSSSNGFGKRSKKGHFGAEKPTESGKRFRVDLFCAFCKRC